MAEHLDPWLEAELRRIEQTDGKVTTLANGKLNRIERVDGRGVLVSTQASDEKGSGPQLVARGCSTLRGATFGRQARSPTGIYLRPTDSTSNDPRPSARSSLASQGSKSRAVDRSNSGIDLGRRKRQPKRRRAPLNGHPRQLTPSFAASTQGPAGRGFRGPNGPRTGRNGRAVRASRVLLVSSGHSTPFARSAPTRPRSALCPV